MARKRLIAILLPGAVVRALNRTLLAGLLAEPGCSRIDEKARGADRDSDTDADARNGTDRTIVTDGTVSCCDAKLVPGGTFPMGKCERGRDAYTRGMRSEQIEKFNL